MPSGDRAVAKAGKDVPVHPQQTTFYHAEHGTGGKDEMITPKHRIQTVSKGESAVTKYRTPY